jgi:hypothetical protein
MHENHTELTSPSKLQSLKGMKISSLCKIAKQTFESHA